MRSRRHEFSKDVKRQAVKRAGGRCEAVGAVYGLPPGERCNGALGPGFEIDHYPVPATDEGSDTLENAVVCCKTCHGYKTRHYDIPMQAKSKRVNDKHSLPGQASRMRSAGFRKAPKQHRARTAIQPKFDGDILAKPLSPTGAADER